MFLRRGQLVILIVNAIYLVIAAFVFLSRKNYEFVMYVGVIVFFFVIIILTNQRVRYPNSILWGLTLWGILHMLGGGLLLKEGTIRLYGLMLVNISETYGIFRYDQFVHIVGFGVATLVMFILLKPLLKERLDKWTSISIVVVMAGLGVGALNEIIEFLATVIVPETGVGGFINSSMDLVADLIGAILAMIYIRVKKGNLE